MDFVSNVFDQTEYRESYGMVVDHILCNLHQRAFGALEGDLCFAHHLQLAGLIPPSL